MTFLLDTNAVSEAARRQPNPGFITWFRATPNRLLHYSVLTIAELARGVSQLEQGPKRQSIEAVIERANRRRAARVLPIDLEVAQAWAIISERHRRIGHAPGVIDELIAATAVVHGLAVVTRNVRHFEHAGCRVLRPWTA